MKDNAYGHGNRIITKEMERCGIDYFAVSHIDEAIRLREFGIKSAILILSYGGNYTTKTEETIAVVAIGYGDGYPRYLSNRHVHVILHGQLAEVIGNICMDQLISDYPPFQGKDHDSSFDTLPFVQTSYQAYHNYSKDQY